MVSESRRGSCAEAGWTNEKGDAAETPSAASPLVYFKRSNTLESLVKVQLPGKRKTTIVAIASTVIIAAIALETLVITTKETVAIGLLVLISVAIVSPGVAMAIPVEVGSLRIVILSTLSIARAGIETVL